MMMLLWKSNEMSHGKDIGQENNIKLSVLPVYKGFGLEG